MSLGKIRGKKYKKRGNGERRVRKTRRKKSLKENLREGDICENMKGKQIEQERGLGGAGRWERGGVKPQTEARRPAGCTDSRGRVLEHKHFSVI